MWNHRLTKEVITDYAFHHLPPAEQEKYVFSDIVVTEPGPDPQYVPGLKDKKANPAKSTRQKKR